MSEQAPGNEITTIDAVADPEHARYAIRIHSSIGTASGGNLVYANGVWFAQARRGEWCTAPFTANELKQASGDLEHTGIDPVRLMSELTDGGTSATLALRRFTAFPRHLQARVRRRGDTLVVGFVTRPDLVLTFSDFGRAPKVALPKSSHQCRSTATSSAERRAAG